MNWLKTSAPFWKQERFEDAGVVRDRMISLVRGASRAQRLDPLARIPELVAARRSLLEAAAGMLNVQPQDLETRDGRVMVRDTDRAMTFAEVMSRLGAGPWRARTRHTP